MSKSKLLNAIVFLALFCGASVLRAATVTTTILHDTFAATAANAGLAIDANGYRAPTSTQAVWYGGGAALTYTQNASVGLSAGNRGLLAYLVPSTDLATIGVGETLTVTMTFKFTGGTGASTAGDFRLGLLNSGGNGTAYNAGGAITDPPAGARIIADNFSLTSGGNTPRGYSGYLVDTTAATTSSSNSQSFWRREGASGRSQQWLGPTSSDLAANTAFAQLLPGAGGGTAGALVNDGTVYVAKLSVTSVAANQVTLAYSVTSGSATVMAYSLTETSDSPRVGFDTFMVLSTYNAALTVTDFLVTRTSIAPAITTPPSDQVVAAGATATFTAVATGAPTPTYQWQKDGSPIAGETSATLTLNNVQTADAGSYTVVAANSAGSVTSPAATLTVLTAPEITAQPASPTIFEGQSVTLSATVRGAPTLVYQWQKDGVDVVDGGGFSGATTAALTRTGAQIADTGAYTLTITNTYGTVTSAAGNLTVYPSTPPTITTQPASQTVYEGADVTFTVAADGPPPFTYVWKKDGVALVDDGRITGSATATLHLGSVPLTDAGSYVVTVSNFAAGVDSAAAVLTVNAAPTPIAPAALAARSITEVGFSARWSASANATGYRLDVATDTAFASLVAGYADLDVGPVLAATVTGLSIDTTYYYRVRAYNSSGTSPSSNTITVRVQTPVAPVITSGASVTFTAGVAGSFTVTATGAPPPTFSATGLPSWLTLDSATGVLAGIAPTLAINPLTKLPIPQSYVIAITATNDKAPDAMQTFTVTVNPAPGVGEPLTVTTLAGLALSTGTTDATGTAARFNHLSAVAVDGAGNAYVADTGSHTVRKVTAAGVVTTLAGRAGVSGSADGTGTAASFNSPSGIAADSAGNIYVADTQNHTVRKVTAAGVVTTIAGTAGASGSADGTGAAARFFWPQGLALDAAAANLYVADTNNHAIRRIVLASGAVSTLAGTVGVAGSADGTGTAAAFNAPEGVAVDKGGNLYVADTGNALIRTITPAGVVSTIAGLAGSTGTVDGAGSAARFNHPAAVGVDANFNVYVVDTDNHTIRKIVSAAGVTTTIAGQGGVPGSADGAGSVDDNGVANNASSVARFNFPTGLAVNTAGDLYVADTDNSTLRVGGVPNAPVITTQPQSQSVTSGATVQFTVKATGRPAPTYAWLLNGAQIDVKKNPSATSATLTIANATAENAGDYTVIVKNAVGTVTSNRAGLVINSTTNPGPVSLAGGGGGGAPTDFFWVALALLVAARWLSRRPQLLRRAAGSRISGLAVLLALVLLPVVAHAQPVITLAPAQQIGALGGSASFTVTATGTSLTYQWQKNGVNLVDSTGHVAGSATATLSLSNLVASDFDNYQVVVGGTGGPVTPTAVPLAQLTPVVSGTTTTQFTLNWGSVAGATSYTVDIGTNRSFANSLLVNAQDVGTATTYTATGLTENTTYFYRVRATGYGGSAIYIARTLSTADSLAGVVLNETFPNITANPISSVNTGLAVDANSYYIPTSTQAAWYPGGTTNVNYLNGALFNVSAGASRAYLAYFTANGTLVTLADGDVLTARIRFKFNDGTVSNTAENFRIALLNSNSAGGNVNVVNGTNATNPARLTNATSLSVTNNAQARGNSGYIADTIASATAPAANSISFWRRLQATWPNDSTTPDSGTTIGSSQWTGPASPSTLTGLAQPNSNFTPINAAGGTAGSLLNDGSDYVLDFSVKRVSSTQVILGLQVTSGATVVQSYSTTQASGTTESSFDTLFIFNNYAAQMSILGLTVAKASPLSTPTATAATGATLSGFTANWTADANAASYRLDVATDSGFTSLVSGYSDLNVGNVSSAAVTGLSAGTPYYYRVRSVNAAGTSASSSTVTTSTSLAAVTATAATSASTSGFTANWGASAGATGYRLDVSTANDFSSFVSGYNDLGVGNVTTAAVTGLTDNITYYYRVRATNGVVTSTASNTITAATLPAPLSITTQPQSQSAVIGDNVTFTVAATSTTTLSYQWQRKPVAGSFADIGGETAASLTLNSVQLADSGTQYQVVVTNAAGPVTSSAATLTVTAGATAAAIDTQPPVSQVVNAGGTITISVVASGTAPITYQWSLGGTPLVDAPGHISGATTATLTISNAVSGDTGSYTVTVANAVPGSVTSDPSALAVQSPPTANAATLVAANRFTANWSSVASATTYKLDVATDSGFTSFVSGFQDLDVGLVTAAPVYGLAGGTTYYYRVRAVSGSVVSASSGTASLTTLAAPVGTVILHDTLSAATLHAGLVSDANSFLTPTAAQAVWASFGTATITYTQHATLGVSAGGTRGLLAYFTPSTSLANLAVGESLSATVTFTMNGGTPSETTGNFRLGLFNSGGNGTAFNDAAASISARYASGVSNSLTGTPTGNTARAYSGYIISSKLASTTSTDTQSYWNRVGTTVAASGSTQIAGPTATDIAATGTFVAIGAPTGGAVGTITNNGSTVYVANLTVKYVSATQVDLTYTVTSGGTTVMSSTASQTTGALTTGFDSLMFFSTYAASPAILDLNITRIAAIPVFDTQPLAHTAIIGDNFSLTASAHGTAPISYRWQRNGVDVTDGAVLSGTTTATLTFTGAQVANSGDYTVIATNAAGSTTSSTATVSVSAAAVAPSITADPQSLTRATGTTATFSVTATGTAPLTYRWRKGGVDLADDSRITGSGTASLSITSLQFADQDNYTVAVTNSVTTVVSNPATLTVTVPPPVIVTAPATQSALTGTRVSFSVYATGAGPLTYQWSKGGAPIVGATTSALTLSGLAAADAADYTVAVTNGGGTTTSSVATLTLVAPASTALPTQPVIPAGVFNVTDAAYGAVGDGTTDNTAAITAAITAAQNAGGGTIQIPAAAGAYLTGPITLRSGMNLQIDGGATLRALPYASYPNATTNPADLITIASGATNVALTGNGVIEGDGSAWWTAYNSNNSINRPRLVQFTRASNVYIGGLTLQNSPQFHIALSGSGGTSNNNITAFGLTITAPGNSPNTDGFDPTATNILIQSCSIAVGDDNIAIKAQNGNCGNMTIADCTFGVGHGLSVGGQTNLGLNGLTVLRCTFNGTTSGLRLKADATQGGAVQNVTYTDLTMTNVPYPIVFYSYYNDVGTPGATSGGNQTTPAKVKAWNATPPDSLFASTIPTWKNITINNLTATGATGYSIIWGLPLADALIANVTLNNVSITGGPGLEVYNAVGVQYTGTTSFPGLITTNALAITAQAAPQTVNPGGTATFGITAAGASGVNGTASTYQWKRNGVAIVDGAQPNGSVITGATTSSVTVAGARLGNAGDYTCTVSTTLDGYNTTTSTLVPDSLPVSATSKAAALAVNAAGSPLSITGQPAGATVTAGDTATFTVTATSDTPLNYQWRKDGVDLADGARISGVNTATLTVTGTLAADAGDYTVVVLNDAGSTTSDPATLVVQTPPAITTQPVGQTVYEGVNVTFSVAATGTAPLTYQWRKDGADLADDARITGSATATLAITGTLVADSGSYTVVVTNPAGQVTSDAAVFTVNLVPTPPPAPVALVATNVTHASFAANWAASAGATGYRLDVATDSTFNAYVSGFQDLDVGTALTRTLGGLTPLTNYYYRVRALNAVGASASSNTITATTTALLVPAVITSANATSFSLGLPSSFTVTATGAPAPVLGVTGLPAWAAFDPATGILSGTPPAGTAGAQFPLTISAQSAGTAAATQLFTLNVQGAPVITTPMTITTVAGLALASGTTDATGSAARFSHLTGVGVDSTGNVYVADTDSHTIRRIAPGGIVTTFAGTAGASGTTNGTGALARFNAPSGIAVDANGNIYVADTLNHAIRLISASGSVSTFLGSPGNAGSADGPVASARFFGPQGLAFFGTGILYIADTNNHVIRKYDVASRTVSTLAGLAGQAGSADGAGSAARFNAPSDLAVDRNGIVYVADTDNSSIRAISPDGVVRTLAGQSGSIGAGDGTAAAARFNHPTALVVDSSLNLFILDTDNHSIRKIASVAGIVTTVAGQPGTAGSADGVGAAARFNDPSGLVQAATGEFYITDTNNYTLRQGVFPNSPVITTHPQGQTVTASATVQFFVVATGQPAPTYQWTFNGSAISGATGTSLSLSNVQAANAGSYAVVVTNTQGSVTSNSAVLTVLAPSGSGGVGGGGGGGAPGLGFYLALGLLVLVRWISLRRSVQSLPTTR